MQLELQQGLEREVNLKKMNDSIMNAFDNATNEENPIL